MLIGCLKAGCMYSLSHSTHRRIVNNCQLIVDGIVSTETVHFVLFVCLFVFFWCCCFSLSSLSVCPFCVLLRLHLIIFV